jgi:hypothetical protein
MNMPFIYFRDAKKYPKEFEEEKKLYKETAK